jgi:hypothetical protein
MNLIDAVVVEILGEPECRYGKWFVTAKVSAYGKESYTDHMFNTETEAKKFKVGDTIQI